MLVSADYRLDGSSFLQWKAEVWERIQPDGTYQLRMTAQDSQGNAIAWFVRNGDQWAWDQRGWIQTGDVNSGIIQLPEEIKIVNQELHVLPGLLNASESARTATPSSAGIVTISDSSSDAGSIGQQLGIEATELTQAIRLRSANQQIINAETLIRTRSGKTISLGTYTFTDASILQASAMNNVEFTASMSNTEASTHYTTPEKLPLGFVESAHSAIAGAAEMQYTFSNDTTSIRLSVYPSRGGVDSRAWKRLSTSETEFHVKETSHGKVYWTSKQDNETPQQAIWDTGRYRFELTASPKSGASGWNETELERLVDALSQAPKD